MIQAILGWEANPTTLVADIEYRLPLLVIKPSRTTLSEFVRSQVVAQALRSQQLLEQAAGSDLPLESLLSDLKKISKVRPLFGIEDPVPLEQRTPFEQGLLAEVEERTLQLENELAETRDLIRQRLIRLGSEKNSALLGEEYLGDAFDSMGSDRKDHFRSALDKFMELVASPNGEVDAATWFFLGWLRWKHENRIADAERAFSKALSLVHHKDALYVLIARLHAYMQFLMRSEETAYASLRRNTMGFETPEIHFELAKYADAAGYTKEFEEHAREAVRSYSTHLLTLMTMDEDRAMRGAA